MVGKWAAMRLAPIVLHPRTVGILRAAAGVVILARPRATTTKWVGVESPSLGVLARSVGVRDVAIGTVGEARARRVVEQRRRWDRLQRRNRHVRGGMQHAACGCSRQRADCPWRSHLAKLAGTAGNVKFSLSGASTLGRLRR